MDAFLKHSAMQKKPDTKEHMLYDDLIQPPPPPRGLNREEDLTRLEFDLSSLLCPQSPAVIDSPLKLELQVTAPPRCTIKPSGTTISVTASVTIALVPPDQPEVKLSSMTMVWTPASGL